jgi:hypothetical protein
VPSEGVTGPDSQTFGLCLTDEPVDGKVRCHKVAVTNVTKQWPVASGQWSVKPAARCEILASATFRDAGHLKDSGRCPVISGQ